MTVRHPVLEIEDLTIRFPGMPRAAIDKVSLSVKPGEVVALIGESGSGKSLVGFASGRMEPPQATLEAEALNTAGHDMLAGTPKTRANILGRELTYIFQEPMSAFSPTRRLGEQMTDTLVNGGGGSRKKAAERAAQMLAEVGITEPGEALRRRPWELSGGMLQRALVALAFEFKPKLVIADEVTTAIDGTMRTLILDMIAERARQTGAAVIFISHDLDCVETIAERSIIMYRGRIVENLPMSEGFDRACHPYSAMLVEATPDRDHPREVLQTPEGAGFAPNDGGCCYRNRCAEEAEACAKPQPLTEIGFGHTVACWRRAS